MNVALSTVKGRPLFLPVRGFFDSRQVREVLYVPPELLLVRRIRPVVPLVRELSRLYSKGFV